MSENRGFALIIIAAAILLLAASFNPASQQASDSETTHAQASTVDRTINISGDCIDSSGFTVVAEFVAQAVNNITNQSVLSKPFSGGVFLIQMNASFAQDNQTITINILGTDQKTHYGNTSLKLSNLNHTSEYSVSIVILNPPPDYNGLWIVVLIVLFALILTGYIIVAKWLIGRAVLKRAGEIMMRDDEHKYRGGGGELP